MSREYFSTARKCFSSPPSCSQLLAFPRCVDKLKDKVETFIDDWAQGKVVDEKKIYLKVLNLFAANLDMYWTFDLGKGCPSQSFQNPGIARIGLTPPPPPNPGTLVDFATKSA